jgi:serine/threonine protein phosphatase PrpC
MPSAALCSLTNDGDVAARLLTVDHNGMNEEEAARIRDQHSKVAR